jgi:hypothetical protein
MKVVATQSSDEFISISGLGNEHGFVLQFKVNRE